MVDFDCGVLGDFLLVCWVYCVFVLLLNVLFDLMVPATGACSFVL